ncbi:MAG: cytochrome P450 [Ignavibacteriales bacterium]|nr:cytochrome P450 [Ignavibacteriales bacterium]
MIMTTETAEDYASPSQAGCLSVHPSIDATPSHGEHREHRAPVRAAPARGGAGWPWSGFK